jgi:hypothetical protein
MTTRSLSDIQGLLDEVRPFLIMAGVPTRRAQIAKGLDYKIKQCARAFDWLHQFSLSPQFEKFKQVRALRPEDVWINYANLGITGLREQVMLKEAGKALMLRWNVKRPRMFGPDKPPKEEYHEIEGCQQEANCPGSEEQCVQPDGDGTAEGDC